MYEKKYIDKVAILADMYYNYKHKSIQTLKENIMKVKGKDIIDVVEKDESYHIKCKDNTEYEIPCSAMSDVDFYFIHGFLLIKMDKEYYADETLRILAKYINSGDGVKCKN